jgi:O-antigen/teichoic acid export membrane protein
VNADARFGTMAAARVAHPLVAKLGAIGAALSIGAHPLALLGFEALGYAVQARIMLGAAWRRLFSPRGALSRRRWRLTAGVVRGHRDMTFYGHASALLALGEIAAESVIVAHFFSVRDAGLFSLALGIASLPVQLVALATASVIYHRFIETARARPGTIFRTVARTLSGYLLVGVPVYGVILWKGPDLFSLALGEEWRESGRLASLLAPALLLVFVLTPLSSIFRVARIQHVALTVDAVFLPIAVTTLLVSSMRLDLFGAITCLAFALCVHRLALLGACLTAARRVSAKAPTREVSACAS